ncbi:DNA-3-methyladenine glycosylase I [Devosia pacifica]|uniref:DNA-3-methyladenine glycosylase I n=1 Tax=Devosia pacifica TaxID=1335967 RepID=A0A918S996_9HYPH|nr:DNA-3-methyladenine glycosylase I [Devosia pacifica]GHA31167.1 DNA-3-methyladenine glycosylase I [Devosia pacifica]
MSTEAEQPQRCQWAGSDPFYCAYHDTEWGRPVADDTRLYEKLCLEGFQAGLSWITILRKRDRFREVFHGFEMERVAQMDESDIERLVKDAGIIRHRGKIVSTINNARRAIDIQQRYGSLAAFVWRHEPGQSERPARITHEAVMAMPSTPASAALSKDLRAHGFTFVGPTTCYAFMQAMGLVNDHIETCFCRDEVEQQRRNFLRPA